METTKRGAVRFYLTLALVISQMVLAILLSFTPLDLSQFLFHSNIYQPIPSFCYFFYKIVFGIYILSFFFLNYKIFYLFYIIKQIPFFSTWVIIVYKWDVEWFHNIMMKKPWAWGCKEQKKYSCRIFLLFEKIK